jgi:hypothetical protein
VDNDLLQSTLKMDLMAGGARLAQVTSRRLILNLRCFVSLCE